MYGALHSGLCAGLSSASSVFVSCSSLITDTGGLSLVNPLIRLFLCLSLNESVSSFESKEQQEVVDGKQSIKLGQQGFQTLLQSVKPVNVR